MPTTLLASQLDKIFAHAQYPGDIALADYWPNEWEGTFARLKGKTWQTITAEDFDSPGGNLEGIQVLSAAAFVYFLPGLIRLALHNSAARYVIVSAMLTRFSREDTDQTAALLQTRIMTMLSAEQRHYLADFFLQTQQLEPTLCPLILNSAVSNLTHGEIKPYRQQDLLRELRQQGLLK